MIRGISSRENSEPIVVTDPMVENRNKVEKANKLKAILDSVQEKLSEITGVANIDTTFASRCIIDRYAESRSQGVENLLNNSERENVWGNLVDLCDGFEFCKGRENKCNEHEQDDPVDFSQFILDTTESGEHQPATSTTLQSHSNENINTNSEQPGTSSNNYSSQSEESTIRKLV